jgi:alkanesulfonate monooxygenase SsuD/methylene tetrahydromethanopterin reductase-like flavin-dependent oxidoreductase (luciferase family)
MKIMTDELIQKFSIAGTPEECIQKIRKLAKLGVKKFWFLPFSGPYSFVKADRTIKPFAEKVMSQFK